MVSQEKKLNKTIGYIPATLALAGNGFITTIKFIGFLISGSGALFAEAVHSLADTVNQGLLIVGIKRSQKKRSEEFPYGFGQERFIWALISACGIFFIGAGITIYHGIYTLMSKREPQISLIIFVILIISLAVELFTLGKAWKELNKEKRKNLKELLKEGDPVSLAVLFEDSVAVLGVIIALISIIIAFLTGNYLWDSLGSVVIGIMLGVIAIILINKNRELLIERSMPDELKEKVIEILEADSVIERVLDFKSSILDIGVYRIKCEVEFNGPALLDEFYKNGMLNKEYQMIRDNYENFLKFSVDFSDRVPRLIGKKIDEIEEKIKEEIPSIKHIDIEIN